MKIKKLKTKENIFRSLPLHLIFLLPSSLDPPQNSNSDVRLGLVKRVDPEEEENELYQVGNHVVKLSVGNVSLA